MNPGTREWPKSIWRVQAQDETYEPVYVESEVAARGLEGQRDIPTAIREYFSTDAPNVLTPEEARLLAMALKSWAAPWEENLQSLRSRLSTWAEEEGH